MEAREWEGEGTDTVRGFVFLTHDRERGAKNINKRKT